MRTLPWKAAAAGVFMLLLSSPPVGASFPRPFGVEVADIDGAAVAVETDLNGLFGVAITTDDTLPNLDDEEIFVFRLTSGRVTADIKGDPDGSFDEGKNVLALSKGSADSTLRHLVVAGPDDVVYFSRIASCDLHSIKLDSTVLAVAVSADGSLAAAGTEAGKLYALRRSGDSCSQRYDVAWSYNATGPVMSVAVSEDAKSIVAGAAKGTGAPAPSGSVYLFKASPSRLGGTNEPVPELRYNTTSNSGAVTKVDASTTADYYVAATAKGQVYVFTNRADLTEENRRNPWIRDLTGTDAGIVGLAMAANGRGIVAGDAEGSVHFVRTTAGNPPDPNQTLAELFSPSYRLAAAVSSVSVDDAGGYAVATAGSTVTGFHLATMSRDVNAPVWQTTLPLAVGGAAISGDGMRIVAATNGRPPGNKFYAWEQFRDFTLTTPTRSVTGNPDEFMTFRLNATNTGSLHDSYRVNLRPPQGWNAPPVEEFGVRAGASRDFEVRTKAPATATPAVYNFTANLTSVGRAPYGKELYLDAVIRHKAALELELDIAERDVDQGKEASFPIKVVNNGNGEDTFKLRVANAADLESRGWTVSLSSELVTVQPKQLETVTLVLRVPANAADGDTGEARIEAESTTTPSVRAGVSAKVIVSPTYGADLQVDKGSVRVEAGRTAQARLTVKNTGNTRDTFALEVSVAGGGSEGKWQAALSQDAVELTQGATREVSLTITPPANAEDGESVSITISAESSGGGEQVDTIVISAVVGADEGIPGFLPLHALGVLALAAALARRRGAR